MVPVPRRYWTFGAGASGRSYISESHLPAVLYEPLATGRGFLLPVRSGQSRFTFTMPQR